MTTKRLRGWALEQAKQEPSISLEKGDRPKQSGLATKLLSLWATGLLSATMVQDIAHLALLDGASHPELLALAKAGNFGGNKGNIHRDIMATFAKGINIEAHEVSTKCLDPKSSLVEHTTASIFLPHMLFYTLAKDYADNFSQIFSTDALENFWKGVEATNDDRLKNHPMALQKDWRSKTIPLFLHGDGVSYQQRDTLLAFSWGSLLSCFSSLDSHFLISLFPKSCTMESTWEPLMQWLIWSFNALLTGKHPALDPFGNGFAEKSQFHALRGLPLAEGNFKAAIWSIQGDHEFFSNVLKLPHWKSQNPCWECDASRNEEPLQKWVKTIRPSQQDFVCVDIDTAALKKASDHVLFSIPGVTSRTVRGDALHILFTKGVYAHLLGSILHYMCWKEGRGRQIVAPWKRLAIIFAAIQKFYGENSTPTRLTNLKISMFCKEGTPHNDFPFFLGKGAESKHLAPALLHVCKASLDPQQDVDKHIVAALEKVCQLVTLFDAADMFLTASEHKDALEKAEAFLDNYSWLNSWALEKERNLFHIVIKHHTFWHLVVNSQYLNPRCHWCFKSEDFVGRISQLTHSVSMSVRSTRLSLKAAAKYKVLLHLRLTRSSFQWVDFANETE